MTIRTVNPYTEKVISEYREDTLEDVKDKFDIVRKNQGEWGKDLDARIAYLKNTLKPNLEKNLNRIASSMTEEMGKPISQSIAEVKKCITLVDYAVENFPKFLEHDVIKTEARKSYVRFDPLGVIELIMPWNYPLWQVFRAAIPAMTLGNGIVLKHASIVSGTSKLMEEVMDSDVFRSVIARGQTALDAIKFSNGVSFTGSTGVGQKIAETAGRELKKAVLELGGSDPFIVLNSADPEKAAKNATLGRMQNNGQSCIASKRFIVQDKIYDEFYKRLMEEFRGLVIGDPSHEKTFLGPLSSKEQAETVRGQIRTLKSAGDVEILSQENGNIVPPVIASPEKPFMDEIFGPVAILKKFSDVKDGIRIANETPYGLGSSVWGDAEEAEKIAPALESGMVFINKIVASDPRVPFGGVKKSGLGRELSRYGLLEFANIRTVWIQE